MLLNEVGRREIPKGALEGPGFLFLSFFSNSHQLDKQM